jgi:hypothetical protein
MIQIARSQNHRQEGRKASNNDEIFGKHRIHVEEYKEDESIVKNPSTSSVDLSCSDLASSSLSSSHNAYSNYTQDLIANVT